MNFEDVHSTDFFLHIITGDEVSETYVEWLQDQRVNKYLEARFNSVTLQSQREYVARVYESTDAYLFGIFVDEKRMIGTLKIGPIDYRLKTGEIGLMIGDPNYWGKGFATRAIGLACRTFFDEGILTRITAGVYGDNIGSRKAFEKNGFTLEKTFKSNGVNIDGNLQEIFRYCKDASF